MSDTLVSHDHDTDITPTELSVEDLLEALSVMPTSADLDKTLHEARFGDELDGPGGCYVGARFKPRDVGLKARPTLDECAAKLISSKTMTVRQRRLLRRYAVLSVLIAVTPREKLRAAARWVQAVDAAGADISDTRRYNAWQEERRIAMSALFESGGTRLAAATAKKWRRGGNTCDFDDIRQAANLGMAKAVFRYAHEKGALSTFAEFSMSDHIGTVVREYEHPHLPRSAFKKRRRILNYVQRCLENDPNCDRRPDFHDHVAAKFEVTPSSVEKVINGAKDVPLNAPARSIAGDGGADGGGGADDLSGVFADEAPSPFDVVASDESVESLKRSLAKVLDEESRDIIFRYEGIGQDGPEDLTAIGESYNRSRTWAGGRRKRALATLQHPIVLAEITGRECTPDELSDELALPTGNPWMDRLSERQQYVARHVMGVGATPMHGDIDQRVAVVANQFGIEIGRVFQMVAQVVAAHPERDAALVRDHNLQACLTAALNFRKTVSSINQAKTLSVAAKRNEPAFEAELLMLEGFEDHAAAS